jgi:hypothetical protein
MGVPAADQVERASFNRAPIGVVEKDRLTTASVVQKNLNHQDTKDTKPPRPGAERRACPIALSSVG